MRRLPHEYLAVARGLLQAGGRADRISGDGARSASRGRRSRPLPSRRPLASGAGSRGSRSTLLTEVAQGPTHLVHRAHGPERVVFMGRGDAEEADQHVADEFLDAGTMPLEHAGREIERASDHQAQGLDRRRRRSARRRRRRTPPSPAYALPVANAPQPAPRASAPLPAAHRAAPGQATDPGGGSPARASSGRCRLDPQLLDQRPPGVPVDLKRVCLPSRPIQRQHELAAQAFPERMLSDERLQLGDELAPRSDGHVGVDPLLDGLESQPSTDRCANGLRT